MKTLNPPGLLAHKIPISLKIPQSTLTHSVGLSATSVQNLGPPAYEQRPLILALPLKGLVTSNLSLYLCYSGPLQASVLSSIK